MLLMMVFCVCVCVCRMFELKDYTKFVYLDADMLVVGVRVWWWPVARYDLISLSLSLIGIRHRTSMSCSRTRPSQRRPTSS